MTKAARLRALLARPGLIPMVGAHDALSARLIEAAGFPVVWSSSFAVSAAQRAMPDVNLLTMTESLEAARAINDAIGLPRPPGRTATSSSSRAWKPSSRGGAWRRPSAARRPTPRRVPT